MINLDIRTNAEIFADYKVGLEFLRGINDADYQYPDNIVYFHLYSEIKNTMQLMAVKSFFATQNLARTKLILWSDYDVSKNELLKPYAHLIEFRVFDPIALAKGTPLEGQKKVLLAKDTKHYMQSGLLRFLAPYVMGGVWFDMDMILLRDLKPILDQEFAYQWGSEADFVNFGPCAAFMNIRAKSEHATICLDELRLAPIRENSVSRDHEMLKKVFARRPFTVFPSTFFNTEWLMNKKYSPLGTLVDTGWFKKNEYSNYLFPEAFAWHWHNGGGGIVTGYEEGSKFALISNYIDQKLRDKDFMV